MYYVLCKNGAQHYIIGYDFQNHRWKDFKILVALKGSFKMKLEVCNHHLFAVFISYDTIQKSMKVMKKIVVQILQQYILNMQLIGMFGREKTLDHTLL